MNKEHTPDWIMTFLRAVYSENAELAAASFNEEKAIRDATEIIHELMAERDRLAAKVKTLRDVISCLLWSADAVWEDEEGGHDWCESCAKARAALDATEPEKETA